MASSKIDPRSILNDRAVWMLSLIVTLLVGGCSRRTERSPVEAPREAVKAPREAVRQVLAREIILPVSIAVDEAGVYWIEWSDPHHRRLRRLDPSGAQTTIADGLTIGSGDLVAVNGFVYWSEPLRGIRRIAHAGGTAEDMARSARHELEFVIDQNTVFWSDEGDVLWRKDPERVPVALARGRIKWPALFGGWIYFLHVMDDSVRRVPVTGGAEEIVLRSCRGAHFAVDASGVYASCDFDETGLRRVPPGGGTPEILVPRHSDFYHLTTDATHVYWSWGIEGSIRRMAKAGGPIEDVVKLTGGHNHIFDFTVHDGAIYWTDSHDKTVERARP